MLALQGIGHCQRGHSRVAEGRAEHARAGEAEGMVRGCRRPEQRARGCVVQAAAGRGSAGALFDALFDR